MQNNNIQHRQQKKIRQHTGQNEKQSNLETDNTMDKRRRTTPWI